MISDRSTPQRTEPGPSRRRRARRRVAAVVGLAAAATLACGLPSLPDPGRPVAPPEEPAVPHVEEGRDCFQRHLREAIRLNERRAPVYAAWTDGASDGVSSRLIRSEKLALLAAWYVDRSARRFQERGIPIGCAEFVSMALTPPLDDRPLDPPADEPGPPPDPDSLQDALADAYGAGGFPAVARAADGVLASLHARPRYHCMTRHLVESIWRVARLAPDHEAAAEAAGLPTTRGLSELLLRLHLAALPDGAALDAEAAPLQRRGIPILCRDVPPIR